MFNWLRKRIYKGWIRLDSSFHIGAGSWISIYKSYAYLSHIETDSMNRMYLLMPAGWFSCEQIWNDL